MVNPKVRGVGSSSGLTLNLLTTLLVAVLRIEMVTSWPTFSLVPTNLHVASVDLIGKLLSSELK